MFGLFSKLMNGIVSLLDKVNCGISCCSNTINVSVPPICSECSRISNNSEVSQLPRATDFPLALEIQKC
jgi:hypothetical protein